VTSRARPYLTDEIYDLFAFSLYTSAANQDGDMYPPAANSFISFFLVRELPFKPFHEFRWVIRWSRVAVTESHHNGLSAGLTLFYAPETLPVAVLGSSRFSGQIGETRRQQLHGPYLGYWIKAAEK